MSDKTTMHYCEKCQRETPHFGYYAHVLLERDTVEVECEECGREQAWRYRDAPWWAFEMADKAETK